jgi:hypothetical protein
MTSGSGGAHPAESFQGLPDAHVTVKYMTPKSKCSGDPAVCLGATRRRL